MGSPGVRLASIAAAIALALAAPTRGSAQCAAAFAPDAMLASPDEPTRARGIEIPGLRIAAHPHVVQARVRGFAELSCEVEVLASGAAVAIRPPLHPDPRCVEAVWLPPPGEWRGITRLDLAPADAAAHGCGTIALRPIASAGTVHASVETDPEVAGQLRRSRLRVVPTPIAGSDRDLARDPDVHLVAIGGEIPLRAVQLHNGVGTIPAETAAALQLDAQPALYVQIGSRWLAGERRAPAIGTYVSRWFFRVLTGAGDQPSSSTPLFATDVEIGARPFLGAFGAFVGVGVQTWGERLTTLSYGVGLQVDLVYTTLALLGRTSLADDPRVSLSIGGRLGLAHGWTARSVDLGGAGTTVQRFELLRPEWRFFVDLEWRPLGTEHALFVRASALDVSIDLGEVSRWSALIGWAYVWDRSGP